MALDDKSVSWTRLMFGIAGCVMLLLVIALVTRRVRRTLQLKLNGRA